MVKSMVNSFLPEFSDFTRVFFSGKSSMQWAPVIPHNVLLHAMNLLGSERTQTIVQCVPIKRKPVLSVRYLHCHARLKQTVCFIIKSIFSSFI